MSAAWLILIACFGTGIIAGWFIDVRALLVGLVVPTLAVLATLAVSGLVTAPWYIFPLGWIAQQVGYGVILMLVRPTMYEILLSRVRIIVRYLTNS